MCVYVFLPFFTLNLRVNEVKYCSAVVEGFSSSPRSFPGPVQSRVLKRPAFWKRTYEKWFFSFTADLCPPFCFFSLFFPVPTPHPLGPSMELIARIDYPLHRLIFSNRRKLCSFSQCQERSSNNAAGNLNLILSSCPLSWCVLRDTLLRGESSLLCILLCVMKEPAATFFFRI